jgi:DNA repair photolyase
MVKCIYNILFLCLFLLSEKYLIPLELRKINGDNLNTVRREASRHFRIRKREYLKEKINEDASNSKNKNIRDMYRGINEFKKAYQHRSNLVKMRMVIACRSLQHLE